MDLHVFRFIYFCPQINCDKLYWFCSCLTVSFFWQSCLNGFFFSLFLYNDGNTCTCKWLTFCFFYNFIFILRLIFCLGWGIWGVTFTERVLLICTCLSSNKRAWLIILCAVLCLFSDGINLTICNLSSRQEMMNIWLDLANNKNKLSALRTNKSNEILLTIFEILFF